jgi:Uma2 family endonuclease
MTATPAQPIERRWITKAEFRALPEGPPDFEFEHGELIPMPRPHGRHQDIVTALARVLPVHVARNRLGRDWVEIDVELTEELTYIPDLVFLTTEHLSRYSEEDGRIHGVPDLVVKVVSRGNPGRDRVTKFNNYLAVGVSWYWLIDAESLILEEYHAEAGRYSRTAAAEAGQAFRPTVFPGLELDLKALLEEQGALT